jgi:hypothetical protein
MIRFAFDVELKEANIMEVSLRVYVLGLLLAVSACSAESPSTSPSPISDGAAGGGGGVVMHEASSTGGSSAPLDDGPGTTNDDASPGIDEDASTETDAAAPGDASVSLPDAGPRTDYACTLIIGINATGEWYKQGFESLVDNARWELMQIHNGFIEKWADPNDAYWSTAIYSPCAMNPKAPDRIMFVLSNFDYTTIEQWLPPLTAVLKNLQAKYPSAKNIELMTWVRAPGNMACPQAPAPRSVISAGEDQAIAQAAKDNPKLVTVAPKFEAKACSEYTDNPPHPTAAGGMAWAKMFAAYYDPMP